MLSTAIVTFDIADQLGNDFDPRRTKVWVTTNVPGDTIVDKAGNKIRLGSGNVTVNTDGTGTLTVWVPGADANPASWQTTIHVDYPDRNARGGRGRRDFGPFTITANADLADLVPEQEIPPTYVSQVTAQLDAKVTEASGFAAAAAASAAQAKSVAGIATSDALVAALVPTSSGSATSAALTATIATVAGKKPDAADRVLYVSKSAQASDSNDGLTLGTAKATIGAACDALTALGGGVIRCGAGSWSLGSSAVGFTIDPNKPVYLEGLGKELTEFVYAGTGIGIKMGDGRKVTDLSVTNGSTTVTSAAAAFTSADVGKTIFAQYVPQDAVISSVTNATTAVVSKAATSTQTGVTAWFSTWFEHAGQLRKFRLTCTHASAAVTGIQLVNVHNGPIEDVRVVGSSYNAGSVGLHAVACFVNYYNRLTIQLFDRGIFLDGFANDTTINDTNIGAKEACLFVKDSTDIRVRGGQYSTTGPSAGGAGVKVIVTGFGNEGGDATGGGSGLVIDQTHFEGNNIGMDVCIGRAADGSTYPVRQPKIHGRFPNGATIDRAYMPIIEAVTLVYGNSKVDLTANCIDPTIVGDVSYRDNVVVNNSATYTKPRPGDQADILASRIPLAPFWLAGDTAARADGTLGNADSGLAWSVAAGSVVIGSKAITAGSDGGFSAANAATLDVGTADHWITVQLDHNPATFAAFLLARVTDASNYYRLGFFPTSLTLDKRVAGTNTTLANITQTCAAGDTIGLRCKGSTLTIYRNGYRIGQVTDSTFTTQTKVGIAPQHTGVRARNLRVRTA